MPKRDSHCMDFPCTAFRRVSKAVIFLLSVCVVISAASANTQESLKLSGPEFTEREIQLIKLFGPWPEKIPPDAGNELSGVSWAETLGEILFNDPGLSGPKTLSCASCHNPEQSFVDGLNVAVGTDRHIRNTQSLFNVGLQRWFGWDGGTDSLWAASLRPILSDIEMAANIDLIAQRFRNKKYVIEALSVVDESNADVAQNNEQFVVWLGKALGAYV